MDEKWFYELPDFKNHSEWIEDRPMSFATDKSLAKIFLCPLGTADAEFVLGMVIRRRNRANPSLILDEYRTLQGKSPLILKWWVEGD